MYVAYAPEVVLPVDAQQQPIATEDLRPAREAAGLGFRDPSMSLHPYLGYVYLPHNERTEPGINIPISQEGFLDSGSSFRTRAEGHLIIGLMGGSAAGQLRTFYKSNT